MEQNKSYGSMNLNETIQQEATAPVIYHVAQVIKVTRVYTSDIHMLLFLISIIQNP